VVNFKKLADRAQKAKAIVDQQGGPGELKRKADRLREVAQGGGSMTDRARAAASVAREKPNPAAEVAGDDAGGPIGGGDAPPRVERPAKS
jgi:hypothetical protein